MLLHASLVQNVLPSQLISFELILIFSVARYLNFGCYWSWSRWNVRWITWFNPLCSTFSQHVCSFPSSLPCAELGPTEVPQSSQSLVSSTIFLHHQVAYFSCSTTNENIKSDLAPEHHVYDEGCFKNWFLNCCPARTSYLDMHEVMVVPTTKSMSEPHPIIATCKPWRSSVSISVLPWALPSPATKRRATFLIP